MTTSLLRRIAEGDEQAVGECYSTYGGLVASIARSMLGPGPEAEDAVQDAFIEIWRSAARFDEARAPEKQFVSMIARRRTVDRLRKKMRHPAPTALPEDMSDPEAGAAERQELLDEARRATEALAQLPENRHKVLEMAILEGHTHASIAESTGIPLGTVKTHVRRGLLKLREMLDVPGDEPA